MHHVTQSFTNFSRDRKSQRHYPRIKLIDWFESCHEMTLSWVRNAYLCPYFPLDSWGQQHGSCGDVRCNQSTEDNHAGAEDSLLSSRQCWVWSLRLHYGVCYNPWPQVVPRFLSDQKGGKAAGDRKAATIKSLMRIHLNAGNDIETPVQTRYAILSLVEYLP